MIKQKELVPKRRFEGFINEWETYELKEILHVNSGRDYKHLNKGNVPVYGTGGLMLKVDDKLSEVDGIGIGRKGTINKPQYLKAPFWTVDTLFFMTPVFKSDLYFMYSKSQTIDWKSMDESTGVPSLSKDTIEKINLFTPRYKEQQRIGQFFKHLDEMIALEQRKIDKTKALKSAYLAEMFPAEGEQVPKRRFEGFTEEWKIKKFDDLAEIVRGASPRPIQNPKWFDKKSNVGWLRISDVTEQSGRINYLEQRISKLGQEKTRVLNKPHLLISIAATVGKPVINNVKTGVHDGFLIFKNPRFDKEFMFQWLEMFRPLWNKYGQPGSQVNLNSNIVKEQKVLLPQLEEQLKISSFFKQLDGMIVNNEFKLNKLKAIKQAYLHEMFV